MSITKKYQKSLWIIFSLAVSLTGLGFLIDSDPPYDSLGLTLFEFAMLALILFTCISVLFFLIEGTKYFLNKAIKKPSQA